MLKKDKLKIILFGVLVLIIGITFYIVGKESPIMKGVALFCLIVWIIGSRLVINKKFK